MPKRAKSDTAQLNLRIKETIRQKIELAARDHGVSMNAEMVDRLQRSFDLDASVVEIFGSRGLFEIMKIVASTMTQIGRGEYMLLRRAADPGDHWLSDAHAYDEAVGAAKKILEMFRPKGDFAGPKTIPVDDGTVLSTRGIGAGTAQAILENLQPDVLSPELRERLLQNLKT
jgi:hypothetical protein